MSANPCDDTGWIRLVTTTVAPETAPVPTPLGEGETLWTTDVAVAAARPGQVAVVPYDGGYSVESDRVDVSFADSSFAPTRCPRRLVPGRLSGIDGRPSGHGRRVLAVGDLPLRRDLLLRLRRSDRHGTATLRVERYDW